MEDVKIVYAENSEQFLHIIGGYVCVVQNSTEERSQIVSGGQCWHSTRRVPRGDPYIAFKDVRQDRDGTYYTDDDSPVDGGFDTAAAKQIAEELGKAIAYLEPGKWKEGQ